MTSRGTGFVVIYQWRLRDGMDTQFLKAWSALTENLKQRGALGSRLHRTDYGTFLAYAQWPDKAAWERSCAVHELDQLLSQQMLDAVEETWSPMFLNVVSDHLVAEPQTKTSHVTH